MSKSDLVRELLQQGKTYSEIQKATGLTGSTISYHANKLGLKKFTFERRHYDWPAIQAAYNEGHTLVELDRMFGCNKAVLHEAALRGDFVKTDDVERRRKVDEKAKELWQSGNPRKKGVPSDLLFTENSWKKTGVIKKAILRRGLLPYSCVIQGCPLFGIESPKWAGKPIVLHLDHINGESTDNRLTNLRFLCPNCHSQTETYCGRNYKNR